MVVRVERRSSKNCRKVSRQIVGNLYTDCRRFLHWAFRPRFHGGSAVTQVNEVPDSHRSPAFALARGFPLKLRRGRGYGAAETQMMKMTRLRARLLRGGPAFAPHSRDYSELESFREQGSIGEQADIAPVEGKAMPRPECPRITRTDAKSSIRRKPFALIRLICGQIYLSSYSKVQRGLSLGPVVGRRGDRRRPLSGGTDSLSATGRIRRGEPVVIDSLLTTLQVW